MGQYWQTILMRLWPVYFSRQIPHLESILLLSNSSPPRPSIFYPQVRSGEAAAAGAAAGGAAAGEAAAGEAAAPDTGNPHIRLPDTGNPHIRLPDTGNPHIRLPDTGHSALKRDYSDQCSDLHRYRSPRHGPRAQESR